MLIHSLQKYIHNVPEISGDTLRKIIGDVGENLIVLKQMTIDSDDHW